MRAVLVGVAAAVLVAAAGPAAGQDAKIDAKLLVGKWTPKDEKGETFTAEFAADGKVTFVGKAGDLEFKIAGTYKLDGNKLSLKMTFGADEKTDTRTVHSLTKTELVSSDSAGKKDTLVRVAGKGNTKED